MGKYRKKPIEVDAFQFYVDNMPDWFMDAVTNNTVILRKCDYKRYSIEETYCEINTLEGVHRCNGGDYVIKGVKGELYPCKPDIFEMTYEKSEDRTDYKDNWNKLKVGILKWQNQLKELENQKLKQGKNRTIGNVYYSMDCAFKKVIEQMERLEE